MAAYVVGHLTIDDQDAYRKYVERFFPILEQYGGRLVMVDDDVEAFAGEWPGGRLVVVEFEDKATARRWYHSDEYQEIAEYRWAASHMHFGVIGQTSPEFAELIASLTRPAATWPAPLTAGRS